MPQTWNRIGHIGGWHPLLPDAQQILPKLLRYVRGDRLRRLRNEAGEKHGILACAGQQPGTTWRCAFTRSET